MGDRDRQAALLGVSERGAHQAEHQEAPGPQSARRAVGGLAETDDRERRSIEPGGQLRAGVAVDGDRGVPGAGQSRDDEPLSPHAGEPDPPTTPIEMSDDLGVDGVIVADLGDRDQHLDGSCWGSAIVHGGGPPTVAPEGRAARRPHRSAAELRPRIHQLTAGRRVLREVLPQLGHAQGQGLLLVLVLQRRCEEQVDGSLRRPA